VSSNPPSTMGGSGLSLAPDTTRLVYRLVEIGGTTQSMGCNKRDPACDFYDLDPPAWLVYKCY